ncbi:uncharacterized LOC128706666 homolog [Haemorhous mexicanus]|nr:uncharacterized LOC128706666 homolog [Haemorhous mexicanus]XP_059696433.1 uncharacterized LOC128706666 homolog [Haemorhous mexicanus]XP_059696434.1 uncharacterized LOC128706666 homolog [Haemorhous mexicanus]
MKKTTWSRKNFLLVAGLSLIGVHIGSMLVNFVAKKSAQSHSEAKRDRP